MYERLPATTTLDELAEEWVSLDRSWTSDACVPEVDYTYAEHEQPVIKLGDHVINLDDDATDRLCGFYKIPTAFFGRITPDERDFVMKHRIAHTVGEVTITYNRHGITDVRKPSQSRLDPEQFIEQASRLLPGATVLDAWANADDLRIDLVNETALHGVQAGLRISQNRKQNLAPVVAPLLHHQATTSILHIPDPSLKIEVRNLDSERVTQMLYSEGLRATARFRSDAEALLALQHVSIAEDGIQRLHRVADEHGLPVRQLAELTSVVAGHTEPTLFDLTIAIANIANSPKLADHSKRGARTKLQAVAGAIVVDHAERCASCHAVVPTAA